MADKINQQEAKEAWRKLYNFITAPLLNDKRLYMEGSEVDTSIKLIERYFSQTPKGRPVKNVWNT